MALRVFLLHLAVCSFCIVASAQNKIDRGVIQGVVREAATGQPLVGVHVRVLGTSNGAVTDLSGRYVFRTAPVGVVTLEARMIGFAETTSIVQVKQGGTPVEAHFLLREEALPMEEIVVTPPPETMTSARISGLYELEGEALKNVTMLGEDVYRAVARLPGMAAGDFSSQFSVRGGEHDEVLVTFDGLELYDPFHLKDIGGGGLSIVDAGVIGGVGLHTGAFPAEFGEKLSGVFDITSATPEPGDSKSALGLSLLNARLFNQGWLKNRRTSWMVVGRRGYLDVLLELTGGEVDFSPRYFDTFAKLVHTFDTRHTVSLQWLLSGDRLKYREALDPNDRVNTRYGNAYLWSNWQAVWGPRLLARTVFSFGKIWRDRDGIDIRRDDLVRFRADDERSFDVLNVKQDWTLDGSGRQVLKWGFNVKHFAAGYSYSNEKLIQRVPDPTHARKVINSYEKTGIEQDRSGTFLGMYSSHKWSLGDRFGGEIGARLGYASWTGDRYLDPRANAMYRLGAGANLRVGLGVFHQPQGIEDLDVQDGSDRYHKAQRARHVVVGFDHAFEPGADLRIDLYSKRVSNPRPRFSSLAGDVTSLFPELDDNRVLFEPQSGHSYGIETTIKKDRSGRFRWWGSYTLAWAEEVVGGRRIPKGFDQRHALRLEFNYTPAPRLRINVAWQYHTGWRYSDVDHEIVRLRGDDVLYQLRYGPRNARQFPAYHRLDARISREFRFQTHRIVGFVEVKNVYNRKNVRMYLYVPETLPDGSIVMRSSPQHWFPILPAFGFHWELSNAD